MGLGGWLAAPLAVGAERRNDIVGLDAGAIPREGNVAGGFPLYEAVPEPTGTAAR